MNPEAVASLSPEVKGDLIRTIYNKMFSGEPLNADDLRTIQAISQSMQGVNIDDQLLLGQILAAGGSTPSSSPVSVNPSMGNMVSSGTAVPATPTSLSVDPTAGSTAMNNRTAPSTSTGSPPATQTSSRPMGGIAGNSGYNPATSNSFDSTTTNDVYSGSGSGPLGVPFVSSEAVMNNPNLLRDLFLTASADQGGIGTGLDVPLRSFLEDDAKYAMLIGSIMGRGGIGRDAGINAASSFMNDISGGEGGYVDPQKLIEEGLRMINSGDALGEDRYRLTGDLAAAAYNYMNPIAQALYGGSLDNAIANAEMARVRNPGSNAYVDDLEAFLRATGGGGSTRRSGGAGGSRVAR